MKTYSFENVVLKVDGKQVKCEPCECEQFTLTPPPHVKLKEGDVLRILNIPELKGLEFIITKKEPGTDFEYSASMREWGNCSAVSLFSLLNGKCCYFERIEGENDGD